MERVFMYLGSDVDGGIIAGRNMDGDLDVRKVTITHFLGFAHEPVNGMYSML